MVWVLGGVVDGVVCTGGGGGRRGEEGEGACSRSHSLEGEEHL